MPRDYRCQIDPGWIDYNRHLRDGYYGVIASAAIDALMDDLGLDADYRSRTACTLYTLEMHLRYLREIKGDARVVVRSFALESDAKRLRLLIDMRTEGSDAPAAVVDTMLMHVHQGATVRSEPFPAEVRARIEAWSTHAVDADLVALGSRALTLGRRP